MIEKFKMQNKNVKLATISFILGFIALCLIITGQSFAIFSGTFTDANEQVVKLGNLEVIMKEPSTGIDLGLSSMTDVEGLLQEEVYTFTVENTGSANAKYKVLIIDDETSKASYTGTLLDKNLVKLGLEVNNKEIGPLTLSELNELLNEKELKSGKKDTYKLRLWIDESANLDEISEQQVFLKLKLEADQYFSEIIINNLDKSGANEPALTSNMIPVYYDSTSDSWKKADSDNADKSSQWYDYDNKMWANAVTVSETNRQTYLSAKTGTTIPMSDINTMWVWVPRYTYTYLNTNTPEEIKIKFEKGTTSSGTIKCVSNVTGTGTTSETCTDTINGNLKAGTSTYTHPAFTFGEDELTGIWVGKFTNSSYVIKKSNEMVENNIIIKPNKTFLKLSASEAFKTIRTMEKTNNMYKFNQKNDTMFNWNGELSYDSNNIDTHMMKNMEWGAVAYFSHSKYGRCTNSICEEITINNCTEAITGIGGNTVDANYSSSACTTTENKYNGSKGKKASTTGNIYGIYDMSGSDTLVMSNVMNSSNQFQTSKAGNWNTTTYPSAKYYDNYSNGYSDNTYQRGKLGDATVEMAPTGRNGNWYSDYANFPYYTNSWFIRGESYVSNSNAGIFAFNSGDGNDKTSRSILAIK